LSDCYIRTELYPDGVAKLRGSNDKVTRPADATPLDFGDAQFLQRQAQATWSDFQWEIEKIGDQKYRVKGTPLSAYAPKMGNAVRTS
jgi:hypothetical protein